jgi:hypothetical protein
MTSITSRQTFYTALLILFCLRHGSLAQSSSGPLYKACTPQDRTYCSNNINSSNCPYDCANKWCARGPASFLPSSPDVCEGQPVLFTYMVPGGVLDVASPPNVVVSNAQGQPDIGLAIDWNDGTNDTVDLSHGTNGSKYHKWSTAQTSPYQASLLYYDQLKYQGQGSCSYMCYLPASIMVTVHSATSPECAGGKYHAVKRKAAETK